MDIIEGITGRRSINFFDPNRKIPEKILFEIIELAGLAPSSFNLQPWEVILVLSPEKKKFSVLRHLISQRLKRPPRQ